LTPLVSISAIKKMNVVSLFLNKEIEMFLPNVCGLTESDEILKTQFWRVQLFAELLKNKKDKNGSVLDRHQTGKNCVVG
jgi:hypothetical protein